MSETNTTVSADEALGEISARVYRAEAIVATTAAAILAENPPDGLALQYALEAASEALNTIASDVAQLQSRMQWVPNAEEARS